MNVSLVMVTADGKSKDLPPMRLPIRIGREKDCKLRIPVPAVSRQHCELVEADDELVVRDLKSSNGTFVNKERVKSRELLPGDLLSVGPVVLVVRIDGHPKAVDPIISWANGAVVAGEDSGSGGGSGGGMDGVPSWSGGSAPAAKAEAKPAAKAMPKSGPPPMKSAPAADKPGALPDLSESDFDIDFGDLDEPKKK